MKFRERGKRGRRPQRGRPPGVLTLTAASSLLHLAIFVGVAAGAEPPVAGDRAPDFSFQGSDGKTYTLQGLLEGGKHGIVLAFFPKAFTPG